MRARLQPWLAARLSGARGLILGQVEFPNEAGRSAESSFIDIVFERNGRQIRDRLVVRRQYDSGIFLDSDLMLPWRMMKAVRQYSNIPVPDCIGIEPDPDILGTPFLVMRRCAGRIAPMTPNYNLGGWITQLRHEDRAMLWRNGIEILVRIHQLEWTPGFQFLDDPERGSPGLEQYLDVLEEWYRWAIGARRFPIAEAALEHVLGQRPAEERVAVLWGDATPHNILFNDDLSVSAVLDWEAAALGPGEMDLAWWLFFNELLSDGIEVERLSGLPSREESIAIYERAAGRTVRDIGYYSLLAELRMTIVGIRASDRRAGGIGRAQVEDLAQSPPCRMLARRLGLRIPEKGSAYERACALFGKSRT